MKKYSKTSDWLYHQLIPDEKALLIPTVSEKADLNVVVQLNSTAISIWDLITHPMTLDEVCDKLEKKLDLTNENFKKDVQNCLQELVQANALEYS